MIARPQPAISQPVEREGHVGEHGGQGLALDVPVGDEVEVAVEQPPAILVSPRVHGRLLTCDELQPSCTFSMPRDGKRNSSCPEASRRLSGPAPPPLMRRTAEATTPSI